MKKYILTITTIFLVSLSIKSNAQCVQCDGNSSALGSYSSVIGMSTSTTIGSNGAFAGGYGSIAAGTFAFAFGNQVTAAGTNSLAIGRFLETATTPAMIFGTGYSPTSRLTNSTPNSLMIGFNSVKPTFFVSGAIGNGYTGKVGIGDVTTPLAKLHIKADANEDADILLMSGSTKYAVVKFGEVSGTSPNRISAKSSGDLNFYSASDFVFWDNNVGIGVYNPTEKLDVEGNIKTTGFVLNNGQQAVNKILQSDANGLASWVDPMSINVDDGDWTIDGNDMYCSNANQYVGIGTSSPDHKLDVHVSGGVYLAHFLNPTSSGYGIYVQGGYQDHPILDLNDNAGNQRMVVLGSGEVGIGVPVPTATLDVAGNIKANSFIGDGSGLTNVDDNDWDIYNNNVYRLSGNVGIGTSIPEEMIEMNKNISRSGKVGIKMVNSGIFPWFIGMDHDNFSDNTFIISDYNKLSSDPPFVSVTVDGRVGIGKVPNAGVKLDIDGKMVCGEVEIISLSKWKDCVFEAGYNLPSLSEVELFISENGHLPQIPSEKEILVKGYNIGEMDAMLLQKIEELTLYVIELEKKIRTFEYSK